jgi:hypothetical protein
LELNFSSFRVVSIIKYKIANKMEDIDISSFLLPVMLGLAWVYLSIAKVFKKCPSCGTTGSASYLSKSELADDNWRETKEEWKQATWWQWWFGKTEKKERRPWKCDKCGCRF